MKTKMTIQEKREAIDAYMKDHPEASVREVSKAVGCSWDMVNNRKGNGTSHDWQYDIGFEFKALAKRSIRLSDESLGRKARGIMRKYFPKFKKK